MRPSPATTAPPASATERRARLGALRDDARRCARCPQLALARTTVVVGGGHPDADVLFVGEAPGWNEDQQGLPLVGAAGRLLTELLAEVGLRRDEVYVTTALKCRPPNNRDALAEELANCRDWLHGQVELVQPKVVCTLGTVPTKLLREDPAGITAVRGRVEVVTLGTRTVRLLPLVHPVAALYQGRLAEQLRADLALLPALIALPAPPQPAGAEPPEGQGWAAGDRGATGPRERRSGDARPSSKDRPAVGDGARSIGDARGGPDRDGESSSGPRPGDDAPAGQLGLF